VNLADSHRPNSAVPLLEFSKRRAPSAQADFALSLMGIRWGVSRERGAAAFHTGRAG
jgi:hypothetical protein